MIRKYTGIIFIILSLVFAFGALSEFEQDMVASIIILLVVSLPLYFTGQLIRTSLREMNRSGKRWIAIYIFCVIAVPLVFYSYENYEERKWHAISDGKYIFYESSSSELGMFSLVFIMVLLLLLSIRLLSPELKRKRILTISIICIGFIYGGFQYMMWSDYRGVHEELGLISQTWFGKRTVQSYEDIGGIYIQPSIHKGRLSDPTDETEFIWKLIFTDKEGANIVYLFRSLSEDDLDHGLQIKEIAHSKHIPVEVGEMRSEVFEWFDFELELKDLEKAAFYQFFEINPNDYSQRSN